MGQFSCSNNEQKRSYEDLFAASKKDPPGLHGPKITNLSIHVVMVHQSIKEPVLLIWLEGATFHWLLSGHKFNTMNM